MSRPRRVAWARDRRPTTSTLLNDRMHAKDCADCLTTAGYIHRFDVSIRLLGTLTPEQKEKLAGVARRCPVYKTLTSEIRIEEMLTER